MSFQPDELREILTIYRAESEEHVERLNAGLLRLEQSPRRAETLEEIFREAHSLKGAARMIGFVAVERIAHALEDLFGLARKGELTLGRGVFDAVFAALDRISRLTEAWLAEPEAPSPPVDDLLARLAAAAAAAARAAAAVSSPAPAGAARPAPPAAALSADPARPAQDAPDAQRSAEPPGGGVRQIEETVRVTTQKLDDLMNQIGEILAARFKLEARLAEIRGIEGRAEELHRAWVAARRAQGGAPAGAAELTELIERLLAESRRLSARFGDDTLRMSLASGELQESINRVRMLPVSSLFNLFPRLLRDIALQEGKEAELVIAGGDVQLDKKVIEELKDPLTHLLRNALDHGIERPEERAAAGKPRLGRVRLGASQRATSVVIEVEDDGAGIDPARVRALALRRGFASEEALREMTDPQVLGLVFRPGFSTKGMITDLSGRGVGLDVVLTNIERLKGSITITSEPGRGAVFSIRLPITLATAPALFVRVSGQDFAIPLAAVETLDEVDLGRVTAVESREAILVGGVPTALVRLHDILGLPGQASLPADGRAPVVVLGATDERVAFLVDELLGEREIVVKGLALPLRRVRCFSGATVLGDGGVALILNVFDLVKASQKSRGLWLDERRRAAAAGERAPRILVVDDSVTTRLLEQGILESSGYEVTVAVDGVDALARLAERPVDLVVSDVEMPRLNGFELTRRLRAEAAHRELPVILVTSLSTDADRQAGIEAGADAYIVKGAFDQGNLLATIRQLL